MKASEQREADREERLFEEARRRMVVEQLLGPGRGIRDARVLDAMERVPRHEFVPASFRYQAYEDRPLPIGEGQTISQPYIVAFMTERLEPQPGDRVLEMGTGSGYQAAVLAEIVSAVAVVISLVYVASEIKQNTRALQ